MAGLYRGVGRVQESTVLIVGMEMYEERSMVRQNRCKERRMDGKNRNKGHDQTLRRSTEEGKSATTEVRVKEGDTIKARREKCDIHESFRNEGRRQSMQKFSKK